MALFRLSKKPSFNNMNVPNSMNLTEDAIKIFKQTLEYVDPGKIIPGVLSWNETKGELSVKDKTILINQEQPIYLIGFGKASVQMALSVEKMLGDCIKDGIVIAPEKYKGQSRIQVFRGSHPLPDKQSLSSSYELVNFLQAIEKNAVVLNVVSGGTSSLFCLPAGDLEIEEIRDIYSLLIDSGATIHEINTVRKVFSSVKGGQILRYLEGTTLIDLMISDITDDQIGVIGSGPSIAQEISATDAFKILKKYGLYQKIPHQARRFLAIEMDKEVHNKNYRSTDDIARHQSFIIASASMMSEKAAKIAESYGYQTKVESSAWDGPIDSFEKYIVKKIRETSGQLNHTPAALIFYGECTVDVQGDGLGGRNQELALRMASHLQSNENNICFLSAGTDGIDGPTDAAGAIVTQKTFQDAINNGIDPKPYLQKNDSYHFFQKAGGHIKPGATGNNLMDLQIVLMSSSES